MMNTMIADRGLLLLVLVGLLSVSCVPCEAAEPPDSVLDALNSLKTSFLGMAASPNENPRSLEEEISEDEATIDVVLQYANESSYNFDCLAGYLIADLHRFSDKFKPGVPIDEGILSRDAWTVGEAPWYGLTMDTYLLLELARGTGVSAFARRVLKAAYDAQQGISYFHEAKYRLAGDVAAGPYGSTPGAELAWCCERFMVESYLSDTFVALPEAAAVVNEYWQRRKNTMLEWGVGHWLSVSCEHATMENVKRLVDALPQD